MAAPRYTGKRARDGWHGLFIIEGLLALSVIVGLTFVTMRIQSMGDATPLNRTAQSDVTEPAAEAPAPMPGEGGAKTP